MKKALIVLGGLLLLLASVTAYAQWGMPMMRGSYSVEEQKALDETLELRKDLHLKRFEFREALRKGDYQKAEAIEKEMDAIAEKLEAKLGPVYGKAKARRGYGMGYGRCGGPCGQGTCGQGPCGQGPCW